jgi:hypothetical protein
MHVADFVTRQIRNQFKLFAVENVSSVLDVN